MSNRCKLFVRLCILATALTAGTWTASARAASLCQNTCCDPSCLSVHLCHPVAGSCVCTPYCVIQPQG